MRIAGQDERIARQDVRITRQERNSDLIILFCLISLYRFYIVQPKILNADWGALCRAISDATELYEEGRMTVAEYKSSVIEW